MPDERALEKWFRFEMAEVQRALVGSPVALGELLAMKTPAARTRGGELHVFDLEVLRGFAQRLSALGRAMVRLPILFYQDRETPGECFVADPGMAQALGELGVIRAGPRGERWWLSEALAREFARNNPSLAQFVLL